MVEIPDVKNIVDSICDLASLAIVGGGVKLDVCSKQRGPAIKNEIATLLPKQVYSYS